MAKMQVDLRRLPSHQQKLRGPVTMMGFRAGYSFTERVRKVLALAREEASELQHEYVGTEHILLAVVREGDNVASAVISNFGVNGRDLRSRVKNIVRSAPADHGQRGSRGPDLPYSSRAKKTLELAMSESRGLHHNYVGTEHLLLGLLHEGKGVAAQVLNDVGITLEPAREETIRVLGAARGHVSPRRPPHVETLAEYPQRLREVMSVAYDIAAERGASEVTPAHAMIALLEHGDGMANTALDRLEVDRAVVLFALNDLAPHAGGAVAPDAVLKPSSLLAMGLAAMESAQREAHAPVPGTQHLMLGILSTSAEVAAVFEASGVTYDMIWDEIRRGTG
jgi:ATP-dependent Clp protease ATP-binding subunit ClpA